ncbi:MAG: hypothetical protein Q8L57_03955, partial [bacterium]|nr:hypothetical protein [bacterium]
MVLTDDKIFYYRDSSAAMPEFLRVLIQGIGSLIYVSIFLAALIFLFPPRPGDSIFWLGLILAIFLVHRVAIRRGRPDVSLEQFLKKWKGGNIAACFSAEAKTALAKSYDLARCRKQAGSGLHLLAVLMDCKATDEILTRLEIDNKKIVKLIDEALTRLPSGDIGSSFDFFEGLAFAAFKEAAGLNQESVCIEDLFLAVFSSADAELAKIFVSLNLNFSDIRNAIIINRVKKNLSGWRILPNSFVQQFSGFFGRPRRVRHRVMNRAWTARPTPILDGFSVDYTDLAYAGLIGFLIGHHQEVESLTNILARDQKNNVLLVGDPGAGKDTIIAHIAFLISRDNVPPKLFDKRLVALNIGDLVAGAQTPGELQARVKAIVDEILNSQNIILYIPDFHNLTKTSGKEYISAADILEPVLDASAFQVVGSTTPADFRRYIEPRSDVANNFEIIRVGEISENEAIQLLSFEAILLERKSKIGIGYFAIKKAVELAHRYLRPKLLPSSADDLIKEVLETVKKSGRKVLRDFDIINLVSKKTKIPVAFAAGEEARELLELEKKIHRRLIDQEEAVKAVSS